MVAASMSAAPPGLMFLRIQSLFILAIGNKLTEEEQWAKLKLVKEIAEEVWGE